LALADETKKIPFGVAPVIGVSSSPRPVNCILTNVFPYFLSEYHGP
jgi:hypothetical protein